MNLSSVLSATLSVSLLSSAVLHGAEPPIDAKDLPRIAAIEPADVVQTFKVKPGFRIELVAAEPLVIDPIAISFDENGRMFVVEMIDYSEMRDETPHWGRIRMLEDTDNDGVFDKATVYADDLPWPTGVFCYDGGIFVAASPDILFFKDTNGDGKADVRKVVFTGFGAGKGDKLNVQALLNSFNWGLDNRIHGQTASNGGLVTPADKPDAKPVELRGRDFHFDPRTLDFAAENGGGQYGMCYDNRGRKFVCSNSRHIQTFMYEARYAERNRFFNMPAALVDIAVDGPAAEVFRISPEEAWRVIRTQWRVSGAVPGIIEGGGRSSGYFTSATGITIYRGNAWPEDMLGDAFIADCGSNLIHRKKVRPDGPGLIAERPFDEQNVEFITSPDLWFRPVQMANAPDGTLYICDMYREIIEHPWSLPKSMKDLLDLNNGNTRGRIYRVVPEHFEQPKPVRLGRASTRELVATLEHPNGWHRDTAARLLYERQDKSAVPLLVRLMERSASPFGRLHAMYALDGLGALREAQVLRGLDDNDPAIRAHAIRLAEKFKSAPSPKVWARLRQLRNDPDVTVRYQLAFTLGEFDLPGKIEGLVAIAERDMDSAWTRAAILSSLAEGAGEMLPILAGEPRVRDSSSGQEMLRQLVVLVGAKNKPEEVAQVFDFIGRTEQPALTFALVRALADGLQRAGSSLAKSGGNVKDILAGANQTALNAEAAEAVRVQAIQLLGVTSYAESGSALVSLLDLKQPQSVQLAALTTLARFSDRQVGIELTKRWETLTPRLRGEAVTILLARPDRATALLQAIDAGAIRASVLDSTQVKFLRGHGDKAVRQFALKVLDAQSTSTRQEVIDSYMPALTLKGDVESGKKIYSERCLSCHRIGSEGFLLGPDMVTVKSTGREKILVNIIDPNSEVRPEYVGYVVETSDDESLIGLIANETATAVTVRQAYGREDVIQRASIIKMQSQGQSIMPEGLEADLTPQQMADLLEYIETAEAGD